MRLYREEKITYTPFPDLIKLLDKETNQCIRQKTGTRNIVKENSTRKSGYNMYRGRTQTDYRNKHYNINQKDEGT